MMNPFRLLTQQDIDDVLGKDIIIASDPATGAQVIFSPLQDKFRFLIDGSEYYSVPRGSTLLDDMLKRYNTFVGAC